MMKQPYEWPGPNSPLNELASCDVCLENYNRTNRAPISINCGHTFCKNCILRIANVEDFECCICRRKVDLDVKNLCKNVTVVGILEHFNLLAVDDTTDVPGSLGERLKREIDAFAHFMLETTEKYLVRIVRYFNIFVGHYLGFLDVNGAGKQMFLHIFNCIQCMRYYLYNNSRYFNPLGYLFAYPMEDSDPKDMFLTVDDQLSVEIEFEGRITYLLQFQQWNICFRRRRYELDLVMERPPTQNPPNEPAHHMLLANSLISAALNEIEIRTNRDKELRNVKMDLIHDNRQVSPEYLELLKNSPISPFDYIRINPDPPVISITPLDVTAFDPETLHDIMESPQLFTNQNDDMKEMARLVQIMGYSRFRPEYYQRASLSDALIQSLLIERFKEPIRMALNYKKP